MDGGFSPVEVDSLAFSFIIIDNYFSASFFTPRYYSQAFFYHIRQMVGLACEDDPVDGETREQLTEEVTEMLLSHAAMLEEYFNIRIDVDDGLLLSLPLVLRDYKPLLAKLPMFLLRMGTEVIVTIFYHCAIKS